MGSFSTMKKVLEERFGFIPSRDITAIIGELEDLGWIYEGED